MSPERKALFMCAAHCQGGHSQAGDAAAEALGVPFPIRMGDLAEKARGEGVNPATLWPWLIRQNGLDYFTMAEMSAAIAAATHPASLEAE